MIVTLSEKCRQLKEKLQAEFRVFQSQLTLTEDKQDTLVNYRQKNENDTGADIKEVYRQYHLILEKLSHINRKQIEIIEDTKRNQDLRFEEELSYLRNLRERRSDYHKRIQRLLRLPVSTELVVLAKKLLNEENFLSLKSDDFDKIIRRPMYIPSPQGITKIYGEFLTNLETYILVYLIGDTLSYKELEQRMVKMEHHGSDVGFNKEKMKHNSHSSLQIGKRQSIVDLPKFTHESEGELAEVRSPGSSKTSQESIKIAPKDSPKSAFDFQRGIKEKAKEPEKGIADGHFKVLHEKPLVETFEIVNEVFATKEMITRKRNEQEGTPLLNSMNTLLQTNDSSDSMLTSSNKEVIVMKDERSKQLTVDAPFNTRSQDGIISNGEDELQKLRLRGSSLFNICQDIVADPEIRYEVQRTT